LKIVPDQVVYRKKSSNIRNVIIRNNDGYAIYLDLYGYSNSHGRANVNFLGNNVVENNGLNGIYCKKSCHFAHNNFGKYYLE
jgi:hypothetical protein